MKFKKKIFDIFLNKKKQQENSEDILGAGGEEKRRKKFRPRSKIWNCPEKIEENAKKGDIRKFFFSSSSKKIEKSSA